MSGAVSRINCCRDAAFGKKWLNAKLGQDWELVLTGSYFKSDAQQTTRVDKRARLRVPGDLAKFLSDRDQAEIVCRCARVTAGEPVTARLLRRLVQLPATEVPVELEQLRITPQRLRA